ncbi:MAG: amino acid permease [Candidatus Latescibacteria bacterium]|nr:amino acid permease [Candidatus Latescibacterota bacterium]
MNLEKKLNLPDVYCIATGAMISSGLFVLPGIAHAQAGPAVVFSYFLAGILALPGMLSQAELVSAMPKAGGTYFYVTRSMGPAAGTIDGLITWFSLSLKSAFALVGMAAFIKVIYDINITIIAVPLCMIFIAINIIGVKEASQLQKILVFCLLALLIYFIIKGIPHVQVNNFVPFAPTGLYGIFSTAGFVFISYGGLLKVASIAEEIKNPTRTVPLGMILSLFSVTILYTLVVFIASGVLGSEQLDHSLTPISDAAQLFMHTRGMILLSIAAILAFVSTANAGIMAASRYPFALSRDGMLPEFIQKINKFHTPYFAILLTGLFVTIALFFNLEFLVMMASSVLILTFIFSCLSVIIMRESRIQNYQPKFKSPLYPWTQLTGIAGFTILLVEMGKETIIESATFIATGLFIYWFYGRIRTTREYALLHLIQRVTAKELTTHSLETELKEIIRERDDILKDRFDNIIENSVILDIKEPMNMEDFFSLAAKNLSPRIQTDEVNLVNLLHERERETSTVIASGLAIPHIIIEGQKTFDIMLVRCKPGITFTGIDQKVDTVFILAGTKDERNFHLRALSAIAQIIHDSHFRSRWLKAQSIEALRDVILLGKRKR